MLLVTGGAGYIGSHFVKAYLRARPDESILVVDNLTDGHAEALDWSNKITLAQVDIADVDAVTALVKSHQIDAVVHFAASCYVGESQTNPAKYFDNNVIRSIRFFEALDKAEVRRVVFSSTCATYGNPEYTPLDEAHSQRPINIYGLTKLMMEQCLEGYCQTKGLSAMCLRYFNAAGADESGLIGESHLCETHLIPLVLQAALGKRPAIEVFGTDYDTPDGTCIRDYVHVNDLASAHLMALEFLKDNPGFHALNLGNTHGTSVTEMIAMCESVTGLEIPVKYGPRRPGDPPRLFANGDKTRDTLGWAPQYDLRQIVETAWHWEQHRRY